MRLIPILVDSFADRDLTNAQMINGRDIIRRLDPERFQVSVFCVGDPDPAIVGRPHTRLIRLPRRRQTPRIFREFVAGGHRIHFYMKAAPASKWYFRLRGRWNGGRITVGTIESQSDLHREPTISSEGIRLWEQTVLRCDYLFSNSRFTQASLESEYGLPSEIVPTGVDTSFFAPTGQHSAARRTRVLFVGSLRPFKGPEFVLDAASRFPEADFVIVGDGLMREGLRERMNREKLSNVSFTGTLFPDAVREQYRQSDIFLFPSRWEGSPRVILEAAACGLPVIARNSYQPETVISEATGFLAGSDAELYSALRCLIANPQRRQEMGAAGRKHIQQFDWGPITRRWEEIFISLASRPGWRQPHGLRGAPPRAMRDRSLCRS